MRVNDLYETYQYAHELRLLRDNCSQFLCEAQGLPLLKNLAAKYSDFDKVKVRRRKAETGDFTETFNEAFEQMHPGLRQRAVFANGLSSFKPLDEGYEPFYVFPIDGYKFMYSREVKNSGQEYKQVFETLFEQFGEEKGNEVLTDLLRFTYKSSDLHEGIDSGSELIIYGIPYFYAVRTTVTESYQELLSLI